MTKAEKNQVLVDLTAKFAESPIFYLTDASSLTVETINKFRRKCFEKGIEFRVAKNTLIRKALEANTTSDYAGIYDALHGPTAVMFSDVPNLPAKVLKEFREDKDKPVLKAAYIEAAVFVGDNQIEVLAKLKSKDELIGEIIGLLQSPARNVISALQSSGGKLAGIVKTLSEKPE
jgi:large subunit ribosomal protein L10